MNKRGELTTAQIVGLILLVVAFAILLFLLFRLNFSEQNKKQVCQSSVMVRASPIIPDEVVPLQCKTTYVCISADKGKCEKDLSDPDVVYKIKTKAQTYQVIADEFADCWWMFGEGQVNYAGAEFIPKLYCSLCSQVVFDKSMSDIFPSRSFSKKEIYSYMTEIKISENQTYSEYIYGTNDLDLISGGLEFDDININERYYIGTGLSSEFGGVGVDAGASMIGAAISLIPIGKIVSAVGKPLAKLAGTWIGTIGKLTGTRGQILIAGGTTHFFLAPMISKIIGIQTVAPFILQLDDPAFEELGCKKLTTTS